MTATAKLIDLNEATRLTRWVNGADEKVRSALRASFPKVTLNFGRDLYELPVPEEDVNAVRAWAQGAIRTKPLDDAHLASVLDEISKRIIVAIERNPPAYIENLIEAHLKAQRETAEGNARLRRNGCAGAVHLGVNWQWTPPFNSAVSLWCEWKHGCSVHQWVERSITERLAERRWLQRHEREIEAAFAAMRQSLSSAEFELCIQRYDADEPPSVERWARTAGLAVLAAARVLDLKALLTGDRERFAKAEELSVSIGTVIRYGAQ